MSSKFPLKPYTVKELSNIYQITEKTMLKWLKPYENQIGEKLGWYYNVNQVKIIFDKLGIPDPE